MSQVSESIYDNGKVIIPMYDVSHIEYVNHPSLGANGILVISSNTKWDGQADNWANACFIPESDKQDFLNAWCRYRSELENIEYTIEEPSQL